MKTAVFAGKCDKSDVVLYLAAILKTCGKKVAVVDMSADRKYKYHTSTIDMDEDIDEHDGVFILYGQDALDKASNEKFDFVLYDIGSLNEWNTINESGTDVSVVFMCTTYRKHNIAINVELAEHIAKSVSNFANILFHTNSSIDASYVLANLYKGDDDAAQRPRYLIYDDEYRHRAQIENEYSARIFFKLVPKEMKAALIGILDTHFGQDQKTVKAAIKTMMKKERRV